MNESRPPPVQEMPAVAQSAPSRPQLPSRLIIGVVALTACFSLPLYRMVRFALESDLYSYILLVPFVSVYLFSLALKTNSSPDRRSNTALGACLISLGVAVLGYFWSSTLSGAQFVAQDSVALTTYSFILCLAGLSALLLDRGTLRSAWFPLVFLLFMAPFPVAVEHGIETFLQHGSAPPAYWLFKLAGTPVFKQDLVFQLPGMALQIAPECSGIRSSIVLFITSLVAGHLFLRSGWRRTVLSAAVIPLALVRNGFRIFTIGELCVHIGPHMIDSAIHHRGGPIFFALSLIPFSILVVWLVRKDRRSPALANPSVNSK